MSEEIKVSRRWFLIGGSAIVAAAALPALPQLEPPPLISRASFQDLFPYREVIDLTFMPGASVEVPSFVNLILPNGECLLHFGVAPHGLLKWCAMPGGEIIITKETLFRIEVTPSPADFQVATVFNVQPDRKKMGRHFSETFGWDKDGILVAPPPLPLDVRDDGLTPADLLKPDPPRPPQTLVEEDEDDDEDYAPDV